MKNIDAFRPRLSIIPSPALWGAGFLALLLTLPAVAAPRSYQRGLDALEQEDFRQAEQLFEAAIAEDASPGPGYHPYFYLGVARTRLNDCQGAVEAFGQVERRRRLPEKIAAEMRSYLRFCEEGGEAKSLNAETAETVRLAREVGRNIRSLQNQANSLGVWGMNFEERRVKMMGLLARAERNLKEAERPPWRARQSEVAAQAADTALAELERFHADVRAAVDQAHSSSPPPPSGRNLPLPPPPEGKSTGRVDDLPPVGRTSAAPATVPPSTSPRVRRGSDPPAALLAAADALFAGNYGAALEILERQDFQDPEAQAHAYLFRAAAHYALHLAGLDDGEDHLLQAERFAADARTVNPGLHPLAQVFSPRFRSFFQGADGS